jgi:uncharacterized membrane protein
MGKGRLEAFSDGVLAILITIMVLELKVPRGADLHALMPFLPSLAWYLLSFVFVGIYWNNHHHLLHASHRVNGAVLWANLHLLFWLSLVPVATTWLGENPSAPIPVALYGAILFMAAIGFTLLVLALVAANGGKDSALAQALGRDFKGKISVVLYGAAIALAFVRASVAEALYVVVALIWLIPDRRIERATLKQPGQEH